MDHQCGMCLFLSPYEVLGPEPASSHLPTSILVLRDHCILGFVDMPFVSFVPLFRKCQQVSKHSTFHVLQSSLWNLGFCVCASICKHAVSLNDNMCNPARGLLGLIDALP